MTNRVNFLWVPWHTQAYISKCLLLFNLFNYLKLATRVLVPNPGIRLTTNGTSHLFTVLTHFLQLYVCGTRRYAYCCDFQLLFNLVSIICPKRPITYLRSFWENSISTKKTRLNDTKRVGVPNDKLVQTVKGYLEPLNETYSLDYRFSNRLLRIEADSADDRNLDRWRMQMFV